MTAQILYLRDYKSREQIELEAMQFEHEVCRIAFEGGPTMEVSMSDVEAYRNAPEYVTEFGGRGSAMGPAPVEPPADCPA
jgi:hypothetical protein